MNWLHHSTPTIIHRDLKTANLLIEKTANLYRVKLCTHRSRGQHGRDGLVIFLFLGDFGLSEIKPKDRAWLQDPKNGAKGTPLFMPPEVMMGQPFDEKSDVYRCVKKEPSSSSCGTHMLFAQFMHHVCVQLRDCAMGNPNKEGTLCSIR